MTVAALRSLIIISSTAALAIITVIIYVIIRARYQKEFLQKKQELQSSQLEEIRQYEAEIQNLLEEINSKKQDTGFLEELVSDCEKYVGEHYSGQPVVDALLAYKKKICANSGVRFELSCSSLAGTGLTDEEYIGVFGNLLDNAIEAAQRTENPWVSLKSSTAGGQWILTVRNNKSEEETPLAHNMATTKQDSKNHGLGSKIVRKTVRKYRGALDYKDRGDSFEVISVIPLSEVQ